MLANCIVSSYNIGSTVAYNLCTGTSQTIPWGTATWLGHTTTAVFVVGMAYLIYDLFRRAEIKVEQVKTKKVN